MWKEIEQNRDNRQEDAHEKRRGMHMRREEGCTLEEKRDTRVLILNKFVKETIVGVRDSQLKKIFLQENMIHVIRTSFALFGQ
tara:strand:+ start:397 stop:645 length:249 start_codon:yes stop_codon:yes gene_type:complete